MYISAIPPMAIRRFVAPIRFVKNNQKTLSVSKSKARKSTKTKSVESSLDNLVTELSVDGPGDIDLGLASGNSKNEGKDFFADPEYDPEEDMAQARFDESKLEVAKEQFVYRPATMQTQIFTSSAFSIRDEYNRRRAINDDRFTYFTLLEAILTYNVLFERLPKGRLGFSYGMTKIMKKEYSVEAKLAIFYKEKVIKKYRIVYDIKRFFFDIYNDLDGNKVGEVDFELVGSANIVEEAKGVLEGITINLDPVWDKISENKIKYQVLKIGHRVLDLTSTSKDSRQGSWSFRGTEDPVSYKMIFSAFETKKDHISTTKKIIIGRSEINIKLSFIDDCIPEPYDADGTILIK
jgi:hypothetical protein